MCIKEKIIRQNIHLFIEQNNDDQRRIDSKLVKLYMNRFVIDEEYQNEIIGVDYLAKFGRVNFHQNLILSADFQRKPREFRDKFEHDIYVRWRRSQSLKLKQDTEIINAAFEKVSQSGTPIDDLHFIIGSSYYMGFYTRNWFSEKAPLQHFPDPNQFRVCQETGEFELREPPHPLEKLTSYIIAKSLVLNFGIDFACTFLCGLKFTFCSKSQFKQAYHSEAIIEERAISSLNNDLERFYVFMMITEKWEKLDRKFGDNQYNELFSFEFVDDSEQVTFLDELSYDHSNSVGAFPEIIQDPINFQMSSDLLDPSITPSRYFFPPMRDPDRQDLKSPFKSYMNNIQ